MGPTKAHLAILFCFGCDPPILRKLGSKFFFWGHPQPKWGVGKKFWRRGALALSDRYAHRKFQIDTTPSGDAIRVSRNPETPTYNIVKKKKNVIVHFSTKDGVEIKLLHIYVWYTL